MGGRLRAAALESLDLMLDRELKNFLFPLLEETEPVRIQQRLAAIAPQPDQAAAQWLPAIVEDTHSNGTEWLAACAMYALVFRKRPAMLPTAGRPSALVTETRARAMSGALQATMATAPSSTHRRGGESMLSTIEKVIILKTVDIFSRTPDRLLAEVAASMQEKEVPAGEPIFAKGEMGQQMFVIVFGQVRVHDKDNTLAELAERSVFGEMGILDNAPRMASVTATTDTVLLSLDQDVLLQLMADRVEIAQGIIHVLSARLRQRSEELLALRQA